MIKLTRILVLSPFKFEIWYKTPSKSATVTSILSFFNLKFHFQYFQSIFNTLCYNTIRIYEIINYTLSEQTTGNSNLYYIWITKPKWNENYKINLLQIDFLTYPACAFFIFTAKVSSTTLLLISSKIIFITKVKI